MDPNRVLSALEKEKELLVEFLDLSEQQLHMLESEDIDAVEALLEERMKLMSDLTEIESSLGNWIEQVRLQPVIDHETHRDLRWLNDDIVALANRVMEVDQKTCSRLETIKHRTTSDLRDLNHGARAISRYGDSFYLPPQMDLEA